VLAGTAAAEIPAGDYNGIIAIEFAFINETRGIKRVRQAAEGITAEPLIFVRDSGHQREVFGGNNLVRIDVVTDDVNRATKD
jgi:hypothetical protein